MQWISVNDRLPEHGQFIGAFRFPFPSFYWMGIYKGVPSEEEDMFDYWISLPELAKEK